MSLTAAQQKAVLARGNVLVVAGAGTGKTTTLVERCLSCLLDEKPRASLDEILMVTFTDAAAAEMRQRIRRRLEQELENRREADDSAAVRHLQEQLALFETAHIGTLHSFCFQLVRQHFYELELDPQLAVMAEEEARLLANETLEAVLQRHYAGRKPANERVRQLIEAQGRGWDLPVRTLVLRLHHYMQTRPDTTGWFESQRAMFAASEPEQWKNWLRSGIAEWSGHWLSALESFRATNDVADRCAAILKSLKHSLADNSGWRDETAKLLAQIQTQKENYPRGKKMAWVNPIETLFDEAEFLSTLVELEDKADPLEQDWKWVRSQMLTLLELAREFTEAFAEAKREMGAVDFHDLEQHALRLLWDKEGKITAIGREWREKLKFVFVDEYQDINAAQDRIIQGLSREGAQSNRFLVGDVKQSIYRFRLAEPTIFRRYAEEWRKGGQVIPLVDNFRSRARILDFVNSFFGLTMHRDIGGVEYDDEARLRPGTSAPLAETKPDVELHLRLKGRGGAQKEEADSDVIGEMADMEEANKEARIVALRLRELIAGKYQIWDAKTESRRAVAWSDMAVLLRSPASKAESYAQEFSRLNVPLEVAQGGFYESLEISDLLSLLKILDNPLQDLPLLAVLHSPLVGLRAEELARIRLVAQGPFWTALVQCNEIAAIATGGGSDFGFATETFQKVKKCLERYAAWRRLARQTSLSRCLEAVLSETHYADWLLTQERGEQRHGNVQRLLALTRQFDEFQRQGLFRFLRFIEAQQIANAEPEVAPAAGENAARLMSIHQSKGLEFPVVVVADLGKNFNEADLRAEFILDEEYGLCPQVNPPDFTARYPSLPYWLARRRQRRELLGEELRLLYVAMTRARDLLILSGSVTEGKFNRDWISSENQPVALPSVRGCGDWLAEWFSNDAKHKIGASEGQNELLRWTIHRDSDLAEAGDKTGGDEVPTSQTLEADPKTWKRIQKRLEWSYPFEAATEQPAKTSVTILRRLAAEQRDIETTSFFEPPDAPRLPARQKARLSGAPSTSKASASAVDIGSAHHTFLELIRLDRVDSIKAISEEARRLEEEGALTPEESAELDFEGVAAFWQSDAGRKVRDKEKFVRRELAFTARFSANEVAQFTTGRTEADLKDEFVVVQGVADLAVILPREIWLVDFKTDSVEAAAVAEKAKTYQPQLKLYARALSRIYQRPVSWCWLYFLAPRKEVAINPE